MPVFRFFCSSMRSAYGNRLVVFRVLAIFSRRTRPPLNCDNYLQFLVAEVFLVALLVFLALFIVFFSDIVLTSLRIRARPLRCYCAPIKG